MQLILEIIIIMLLSVIIYQDYKFRAVTWIVFPAVLAVSIFYNLSNSLVDFWNNCLINLSFVVAQLLLLTVYFSFRNRRLVNITSSYLGWGDILFLFNLCFFFSPLNFIFFYMASLLMIVFIYIINHSIKKNSFNKIPFAGLQALFFVVLIGFSKYSEYINLSNDDWVATYLM